MKKKITLLLLAVTCSLCFAFSLAACGGDGGGDGNGDGGKTVTGLVIVDSNGGEHDSYDMGSIAYGTTPDWSSLQLYVKYSDGSKALAGDDSNISVTYNFNGQEVDGQHYDVGSYCISYRYGDAVSGVSVSYEIITSATASPYTLSLDKISWKYPEAPTATLTKGGAEISGYNVYSITLEKYNEIKNAADFKEKLNENREWFSSDSLKPGKYCLFADKDGSNSNFVTVTIQKGDVTPTDTDNFSGYYSYGGAVGKVSLSEVGINSTTNCDWKNSKGETISGSLQWQNPEEKVDCNNNGVRRKIKFVPSDDFADYYNEYVVPEPIPVTISKSYLNLPGFDYESLGYSNKIWDGEDSVIKLDWSSSYSLEHFKALVKVTHKGTEIDLGNNGLLGTESEIGEYRYSFELKDKVNYYWWNNEDVDNESDVADKSLVYTISPIGSFINVYPQDASYYTIDENRQVKIQIKPGTATDGSCNATPYEEGTLQAKVLAQYTMDPSNPEGSTETSRIAGTVEVVNEGGYDWVVITVTDFKEQPYDGLILIELKATGKDHYADIDYVATSLSIEKYKGTITCPITAGETIEKPIGTKVKELYEAYPGLETNLGKWVMYIKYTQYSDWSEPDMELELPSGEYSFKAVYESDFVQYVGEIEPVEFTVKGVNNT